LNRDSIIYWIKVISQEEQRVILDQG